MKSNLSGTWQQPTAGTPCWHDLVALIPEHSQDPAAEQPLVWSGTYRLFEVWPQNLRETCSLLHDNDWLNDGICPLVLSHFPLFEVHVAEIPRHVPWRRVVGTLEEELQGLRKIIVDPLRVRGLPCVDFVDFVAVLINGGEIRIWHGSNTTATDATADIVRQTNKEKTIWEQTAACCLAIRSSRPMALNDFENASWAIDSLLPEKSFVVVSTQVEFDESADFRVSLMSVMIRNDQKEFKLRSPLNSSVRLLKKPDRHEPDAELAAHMVTAPRKDGKSA